MLLTPLKNLRSVPMSEITAASFKKGNFITPREKVTFFDWNTEQVFNNLELARFDKMPALMNARYSLHVNVSNWDSVNLCHVISVLCFDESLANKYQIIKYSVGSKAVLSVEGFKTISACKKYISQTKVI